jgi:hypothetical protein
MKKIVEGLDETMVPVFFKNIFLTVLRRIIQVGDQLDEKFLL